MDITTEHYFGVKPHSIAQEEEAKTLLLRVNNLIAEAVAKGEFQRQIDPDTGTQISGSRGGAGDGGFRLPTATTGQGHSSHKEARGVDVYDPYGKLDDWLTSFEHDGAGGNKKLEEYGLYREAPSATVHWCHLTTRAPGSGRRTFNP